MTLITTRLEAQSLAHNTRAPEQTHQDQNPQPPSPLSSTAHSLTTMTTASAEGNSPAFSAGTPFQQLLDDLRHRKYSLESVQQAVKIYHPMSIEDPSADTLNQLEQALNLQDVKWTSENVKKDIIMELQDHLLHKALRKSGYYPCTYSRNCIEILPYRGKNSKKKNRPLPSWLEDLGVFVVTNKTLSFRRESAAANQKIVEGTAVGQGTLGPIMTSHIPASEPTTSEPTSRVYVVLTAGHVIPDGVDHIDLAVAGAERRIVKLRVSETSKRLQGRRICGNSDRPAVDDVGFLLISPGDLDIVKHDYHNINFHHFCSYPLDEKAMLEPLIQGRFYRIRNELHRSRIVVFKIGASTDLTMGYLEKVHRTSPKGWYSDSEQSDLDTAFIEFTEDTSLCAENQEREKQGDTSSDSSEASSDYSDRSSNDGEVIDWFGEVSWSTIGFASPGDSGSLVFCS